MFDQLLQTVKEHLEGNAAVVSSIPQKDSDAIHQEIANAIANNMDGVKEDWIASMLPGCSLNDIVQNLIKTLSGKFNLSSETVNTITAQLPCIVKCFLHKNNMHNFLGDSFNLYK